VYRWLTSEIWPSGLLDHGVKAQSGLVRARCLWLAGPLLVAGMTQDSNERARQLALELRSLSDTLASASNGKVLETMQGPHGAGSCTDNR
jgi:hypothetical protein